MTDYSFRITSPQSFASDLNAMIAANGGVPLQFLDASNDLISVEITAAVRMDFDVFDLPRPPPPAAQTGTNRRVNARLTPLPSADPAMAAQDIAIWEGAISSWFGLGGAQPKCPTLVNYTNTAADAEFPVAGQIWPSTGNTILINPPSNTPYRVWA